MFYIWSLILTYWQKSILHSVSCMCVCFCSTCCVCRLYKLTRMYACTRVYVLSFVWRTCRQVCLHLQTTWCVGICRSTDWSIYISIYLRVYVSLCRCIRGLVPCQHSIRCKSLCLGVCAINSFWTITCQLSLCRTVASFRRPLTSRLGADRACC